MPPTTSKRQKYYFPDKLTAQLGQIAQYPLTVIEAPSGFGKTTAVREYLKSAHPQAACVWYTCLGESAFGAWNGVCALFAGINSEIADGLKSLKTPTRDTLFYIADYLKRFKCRKETFLIVDNYQLVNFDLHRELINVFSMHGNPNLHMIFIMQQLDFEQQLSAHNDNIHTIDAAAFFFDREGIANLFRTEGLKLTDGALERVFKSTEGWISAIRLQMINYKETGDFVRSAGIEQLVEMSVWNRITPTEKDFLLAVSVFDSFTAQQAAAMLDVEILPDRLEARLKTNDFIRFVPDERLFIIHGILLDYLRNRFYYHRPREYRDAMLRKAALSCAALGQYCSAARFFYQLRDFDAILSLPFTRQYLDAQNEEREDALFMAIVQECPEKILCRYPAAMIVLAHYALFRGKDGLYEKLRGLLRVALQGETKMLWEEARRLTGELLLLEALGNFNDLAKMREGYEAARVILKESPDIIENSTPWFAVFPTTLGMFWREPGQLGGVLRTVEALIPIGHRCSRRQGAGLSSLIRAEAMLVRGIDNEAEILCHKTLYAARDARQISICIYAELCLARIFMLRGDAPGFLAAMENIKKYAAEHSEDAAIRHMADMCLSIISLLLGTKDYVAPWLYDMEGIQKMLYAPVVPFAKILYLRLLLIDKRYNELYAVIQLTLEARRDPGAKIKYVMPQLYCLIYLAVAKHNSGEISQARSYLKEALDMAFADGAWLPFAEHARMGLLLSELGVCHFDGGNPPFSCAASRQGCEGRRRSEPPAPSRGKKADNFAVLCALCKRQADGVGVIQKALLRNKSPLTPREREIALLLKKRLSAKEIAAQLYISEKTVRTISSSVYSKLNIHSKNELNSVIF